MSAPAEGTTLGASVVEAVEVLLLARGVAPSEVDLVRHLGCEDRAAVSSVRDALAAAVRNGVLEQHDEFGQTRYWVAGTLDQAPRNSRRQLVAAIASSAVIATGRAMLVGEIVEFAESRYADVYGPAGLTPTLVGQSLASLVQTGDFVVAGTVRGGVGGMGTNLYMPTRLYASAGALLPTSPLTWTAYAADVFEVMWKERASAAEKVGMRPRAITTDEFRVRLKSDEAAPACPVALDRWGVDLGDAQTVVNVLGALSRGTAPVTRRVPGISAAWLPAGAADDAADVSGSFAKDADRVVEALRRAMARAGEPAVSAKQVAAECEADPALAPVGKTTVARALSDAARTAIVTTGGLRTRRRVQRVQRLGSAGGVALYTAPPEIGGDVAVRAAVRHVETRGLLTEAARLGLGAEYRDADCHPTTVIAVGRMRLLRQRGLSLAERAKAVASGPGGRGAASDALDALEVEMRELADRAAAWERFRRVTAPQGIQNTAPVITAAELRELLAGVTTSVTLGDPLGAIVSRFTRLIPRVPNPRFERRQSRNPETAAEYHYDLTGALLYAAREWGGVRARVAAAVAEAALGPLRDARFVLEAIQSPHAVERIRHVQTLAFLRGPDVIECLRSRLENDVDHGVRAVALWAYGFAGGSDANVIVADVAAADPEPSVRKDATRLLAAATQGWWRA